MPVGATRLLVPRLREFLARHPGLSVELLVNDRVENLVEARIDLALRVGVVNDASLVIRAIGTFGRIAVAAPAYLERHGAPATPADLTRHSCVIHDLGPESAYWTFDGPDGSMRVLVSGALIANSTEVVRQAALAGYGIALLTELQVMDDIRAVRLYRLLPDYPIERYQVFIVYPSRRHLAPRTRAVIDFLVEQFRTIETRLIEERLWGETDAAWLV
jgi:DNA-binding transcriptional LysR family regulator